MSFRCRRRTGWSGTNSESELGEVEAGDCVAAASDEPDNVCPLIPKPQRVSTKGALQHRGLVANIGVETQQNNVAVPELRSTNVCPCGREAGCVYGGNRKIPQ